MINANELIQAIFEGQQTLLDEYNLIIEQLNGFYECRRCIPNWCCETIPVQLRKEKIPLLAQHMNLSKNNFLDKYCDISEGFMGMPFVYLKSPCPFFKKGIKNRRYPSCRIYKIRPSVCKQFPFTERLGVTSINRCPRASEIAKDLKKLHKMYDSKELPYELSDIETIITRFQKMLKETVEWPILSEKMEWKRLEEMDSETILREQFNIEQELSRSFLPKNTTKGWEALNVVVSFPWFRDLFRLKCEGFTLREDVYSLEYSRKVD